MFVQCDHRKNLELLNKTSFSATRPLVQRESKQMLTGNLYGLSTFVRVYLNPTASVSSITFSLQKIGPAGAALSLVIAQCAFKSRQTRELVFLSLPFIPKRKSHAISTREYTFQFAT